MCKKFIFTSLYIDTNKIDLIKKIATDKKISSNEVISSLLKNYLEKQPKKGKVLTSVKYQNSDPLKGWKIRHVRFRPVDYEVFFDFRKFFKMSVSLLLAKAIDDFLNNGFSEDKCNNYQNGFYEISYKIENLYRCLNIKWKKEKKKEKIE